MKTIQKSILSSVPFLKLTRGILVFIISLVVFSSCNETKVIGPETLGYDYYPIAIGQYRVYDVEEIKYRIAGFDTTIYQLRETIFDSLISTDQITYLIRRDIRASELEEWESDSIWSVTRAASYLSITENGISFIKLTFPVNLENEWNGNSLNSRGELTYYYQAVAEAVIDSIPSLDHIRVIIEDIEQNITGVDLKSEVYARGIGLVEKSYLTQENCTASSCGEDLGKVVGGRSLKQTLIEIGNE